MEVIDQRKRGAENEEEMGERKKKMIERREEMSAKCFSRCCKMGWGLLFFNVDSHSNNLFL